MERIRNAISLDCDRLVEIFVRNGTRAFTIFCEEWKKMCFQHMYTGLQRDVEIIQMTESIFYVAGEILFENDSVPKHKERKIGALYLIHAIYFKQPTDQYVKIKLTLEKWKLLNEFIVSIKEDPSTIQARYIFYQLITANAFRFVAIERDYGLEEIFNSEYLKEKQKRRHIWDAVISSMSEINHPQKGLVDSLLVLEGGYNEMKKILNEQCALPQQIDTALFSDELKEDCKSVSCTLKPNPEEQKNKSDNTELHENKRLRIDERRKKIKKKAYKSSGNEEGLEYNICLVGDMIHIAKDDVRPRVRLQTVQSILEQTLPTDASNELQSEEMLL